MQIFIPLGNLTRKGVRAINLHKIVLCCLIFLWGSQGNTLAADDTPPPLDESLFDLGYEPVQNALETCEKHFGQKIKIPYKLPSLVFTHHFGRCNKTFGINNDFEVLYIHEKLTRNHYTIRVRPAKHRIHFREDLFTKTYKLWDGSFAFYSTTLARGSNVLVFEKNYWQYIISIDKKTSKKVKPEIFVEIANSLDDSHF
jgi:hypothetical protein